MVTKRKVISLSFILVVSILVNMPMALAGSVSFRFDSWLYGNNNGIYHSLNSGTAYLQTSSRIDAYDPGLNYKRYYVRLYREGFLWDDYLGEHSQHAYADRWTTNTAQWTVDKSSDKYYLVFWTEQPYNALIYGSGLLSN